MSDLTAATTALNTLIGQYSLTRDQVVDLMSGAADGGPNGDGLYPVTLDSGAVVNIPSPLAIQQSVLASISSAALGIEAVADTAARDTFYGDTSNQSKLVYVNNNNGSGDDPANTIYEYVDGAPRVATAFLNAFTVIFQALVDEAQSYAASIADLTEPVSANLYDPATMRVDGQLIGTNNTISAAAGWAYGKVAGSPGDVVALGTNTTRRVGTTFLDADGVPLAGQYDGYAGLTQSRTFPAGAAFFAFNVESTSVPEPTEIMVNAGPAVLPYEPYSSGRVIPIDAVDGLADELASAGKDQLTSTLEPTWINVLANGDYVLGDQEMRTAAAAVNLTQPELLARGYTRGLEWPAGNDYARYRGTDDLDGSYVFGAFLVYSENPANLIDAGHVKLLTETDAGGIADMAGIATGVVSLSTKLQLVWATAQVAVANTHRMLIGTTLAPADTSRIATGWTMFFSDSTFDTEEALRQIFLADKARAPSTKRSLATGGTVVSPAMLVLAGADQTAYIQSTRSGHTIRNDFIPFPTLQLTTTPDRFKIGAQYLDGAVVRDLGDDNAPDHTQGTTLGGDHGFTLGTVTAAAHGKTAASQGQIVSTGGVESVLVKVVDADTLLLAVTDSNSVPATGDYTYVSGPGETGGFSATAVASTMWYPPHNNYSLTTWVDGQLITDKVGSWAYNRSVLFVELCDILSRQSIIDWWIANGGVSGGLTPSGTALYRMVTSYRYDMDGQLTIHRSWAFLADTTVQDLMGIQAQQKNAPDTYRIPGALPFAYDGDTLDYGMGVAADRTLSAAGTPDINFTSTMLQAEGEYAHRVLTLWADHVFAAGILPVGDAAYDVRRARVSHWALQIRGDSGKLYWRLKDNGSGVVPAGSFFEGVFLRNVAVLPASGPLVTVARMSDSRAFIYADWADFAGLDQIAVPPDLIGWTLTVRDSRNAALLGGALSTGSITANVTSGGDHGYLVIEATA